MFQYKSASVGQGLKSLMMFALAECWCLIVPTYLANLRATLVFFYAQWYCKLCAHTVLEQHMGTTAVFFISTTHCRPILPFSFCVFVTSDSTFSFWSASIVFLNDLTSVAELVL